ncbi:MAG: protein-L-isoaspartate(D-aspartate) O-methyltransferase [Balneolaceae bacterium]|nr:protein-L-isoaspartate(D-aspartate) O-methyltransferase [Balneolaceae bacterium]
MKNILAPILAALLLLMAGQAAPVCAQQAAADSTVIDTAVAGQDTVRWTKPRFSARSDERLQLVRTGIEGEGISDPTVLEAMRQVPRHLFMAEGQRPLAYRNTALPIEEGQTISQPYIVAYMTQLLELQASDKVLEIGTGSGYQAAVLSEITPFVYSIEIVEELGRQARERFDRLGYTTIETRIGDGYAGWEEHAPFDKIIITAAAPEIPQPLLEQLSPGGILVMPMGREGGIQMLIKVSKSEEGEIHEKSVIPVRFVPMTGKVRGDGNG